MTFVSVLTPFLLALLVHYDYLTFSQDMYVRHNRATQWLVQGVSLSIFAVLSVNLVNQLRFNLLETITHLGESNEKLREANHKLENRKNEIARLAYYDQLTGLPNRSYFKQHIGERIDAGVSSAALVVFDLRGFRIINSLLGTSYGDTVLRAIAEYLKNWADESNFFARLGGDEFGLWVEDYDTETLIGDIEGSAATLIREIERDYKLAHRIEYNTAAARFPEDGSSYHACEQAAAAAMKVAKERKTTRVLFFDKDVFDTVQADAKMQQLLERAVENNEFRVLYQPKVNIRTRETIGVEALSRWSPPEIGPVRPDVFIDHLTRLDLIVPFSKGMIKRVLSDLPALKEKLNQDLVVSINISPVMFLEQNFVQYIMNELRAYDVDPHRIVLEITEDVFIDDHETIKEVFSELRGRGIGVALDDFGKGYSSLSYISSFEFSEIKVDRLFTEHVSTDARSYSLFQSICSIADAYNHKVVAEGVEKEDQIETILLAGCDIAQGYYFSKPQAL
ncbi:MAG: putative bifunctional diguanylate cyclase/phosphodiesterase [Spirochaetota bacterium]